MVAERKTKLNARTPRSNTVGAGATDSFSTLRFSCYLFMPIRARILMFVINSYADIHTMTQIIIRDDVRLVLCIIL